MWRGFLLISFAVFTQVVSAQTMLNFQQCLDQAFENNIQLKQAQQQLLLVEINRNQTKYNLLPTFNGQVSVSNSFGKSIDPSTNLFVTNGVQATNLSLSSSLPLFAGMQRWKSIKQSNVDVIKSGYDLEKSRNDVALLVASSYLQLLLNKEVKKASLNRLELLKEQVATTEKMVEAGRLPESNLLDIKAQLGAEQFSLANSETQLEMSRLQLAQLMGMTEYKNLEIKTPNIVINDSIKINTTEAQIIEAAMLRFPQIKSAEKSIVSNEIGLQISKARYAPSLNLTGVAFTQGTSSLSDAGFTYRDQFEQFFRSQVSIGLNIPLLNNFSVRNGVKSSRIQLEIAKLTYENTQNQLENDVQKAYLDVQSAHKNYQAALAQFETMSLALNNAKVRYENSMLSGTDYRVSITNKTKAESDLIQAKYRYIFNTKILDFYLGNDIKF